ncbi:hypothetical protein CY0110_19867 [Crocosphaera chwakensis CCY0110]|uniref:Uncharacterized protein n=1 Tax=Crocosphaera chwakensis CCY0110 TaxID=391612 RepID=A3IJV5_9CHRO|nr:hypothetical protein CY0110_19867 [Crocosphaera chwakensis CCY0110]
MIDRFIANKEALRIFKRSIS